MNGVDQLAEFFSKLRVIRGGSLTKTQVIEANRLIDTFGLAKTCERYGITLKMPPEQISLEQWRDINPRANPEICKQLNTYLYQYQIDTPQELVMFLANAYVESQGFTRFRESFAYKPARLLAVFPSRVKTLAKATELCNKGQEAIANFLYDNRFGNGVGEGWKYRGGGIFQTTFKSNYAELDKSLGGVGLVADPSKIVLPELAVRSALFYWKSKNIDAILAEYGRRVDLALPEVRRVINGGSNGIEEVREQLVRIGRIMNVK